MRACHMSAGLTNESAKMVVVEVNLDLVENQNPKVMPEETEQIRVHRARVRHLMDYINCAEADGLMLYAGLRSFAEGLHLTLAGVGTNS